MRLPVPPLLVISDRRQAHRPLEALAEAAFAGGSRWFSLREKDLRSAERRAMLRALVALGRRAAQPSWCMRISTRRSKRARPVSTCRAEQPRRSARSISRRADRRLGAWRRRSLGTAGRRRRLRYREPCLPHCQQAGVRPGARARRLGQGRGARIGPRRRARRRHCRECRAVPGGRSEGVAVMGEVMRAADPQATVAALVCAISDSPRQKILG